MCLEWTISQPTLLGRPEKDIEGKTLPVSLLFLASGYTSRGLLVAALATAANP